MRMIVLNSEGFKNYNCESNCRQLSSIFKYTDWNSFHSKTPKYLYSNRSIIVEVFANYKEL